MENRIDDMLEERTAADEAYEEKVNSEIRSGMIRTIYSSGNVTWSRNCIAHAIRSYFFLFLRR